MTQPRMKHFGWGYEGDGLTSAEKAFVLGSIEHQLGPLADGEVKPPRLEDLKLGHPGSIHLLRCRSARQGFMIVPHIPTANHSLTISADSSAIIATRQTSLLIHALRKRSHWCLTGQAALRPA